MFGVLVVGRFIGVVCFYYVFKLCAKKSLTLRFRDLFFIYYGGLIRGAIAFGLVLRIEGVPNREVIVTTSLSLVLASTVIFGSTLPLV